MAKQMTPLLRPLRDNSGTIYVFPSAIEDIGLNLDSRANNVELSKYVVLNLPDSNTAYSIDSETENPDKNYFNFTNIPGVANILNNSSMTNSQKIASVLQNYMMNMEVTMTNQDDYDYSASSTISERVFWKFLKETGAIRWVPVNSEVASLHGQRIYKEEDDSSVGYKRVVQSIGKISSGNSVSEDFGMYNETYVNIPSSFGGSRVYFKVVEDNNYRLGEVYTNYDKEYLAGRNSALSIETYTVNKPVYDYFSVVNATEGNSDIYATVIEGRETYLEGGRASDDDEDIDDEENVDTNDTERNVITPWFEYTNDVPANTPYSYFTESEIKEGDDINYVMGIVGQNGEIERKFKRSRLDGVQVVVDIDEISEIYDQILPDHSYVTYDSINIDDDMIYVNNYDFNAILLYYTIYDKNNGNELATNLFGIVFLNSPDVNTMSFEYNTGDEIQFSIPPFKKIKSGGAMSEKYFGTGFSFKVNIRSLSVYDNTDAIIYDNTTSSALYNEDFGTVFHELNNSIELMNKNTQILGSVFSDYKKISNEVDDLKFSVQRLEREVKNVTLSSFTNLDASYIDTNWLKVEGDVEFNGRVHFSEDCDFDIPYFNSAKIESGEIVAEDASFKKLEVGEMTMDNMSISSLDVSSLIVIGNDNGGLFVDDSDVVLSVDADVMSQVIEPVYVDIRDDGRTYREEIEGILLATEVAPVDGKYIIVPHSVNSMSEFDNTGRLFKNRPEGAFVNYMGYVPLLVSEMGKLMKDYETVSTLVNNLKSENEILKLEIEDLKK